MMMAQHFRDLMARRQSAGAPTCRECFRVARYKCCGQLYCVEHHGAHTLQTFLAGLYHIADPGSPIPERVTGPGPADPLDKE